MINIKWLAVLVLVVICGCDFTQYVNGPALTEVGEVYDSCYVPSGHGSDTVVGYNTGKNGGITITPVTINIPARYAIVFKCQHGKFVIDGERGEVLYNKLSKGDTVNIIYCQELEVYRKAAITNIIGLHFLDAKIIEK